jgi:hypothetical protein
VPVVRTYRREFTVTRHEVGANECIEVIGAKYGFYPLTIWNDDANAPLREKRETHEMLVPGDIVEIPELTLRDEDSATESKHTFRRKGVPSKFKLRILDDQDRPVAGAPYTTVIDNMHGPAGTTDAEGFIEFGVSPMAGLLVIKVETDVEWAREMTFQLSNLQPIDTVIGVKARLSSLGYFAEGLDAKVTADFVDAVAAFARDYELAAGVTHESEAFRAALKDAYGA